MASKADLMGSTAVVPYQPEDGGVDNVTENSGYVPEGFKSVDAYLTDMRQSFDADAAYDRENREAALDDLKFVAGEQWDPTVKAARLAQGRPCLTINVLPQFVGQVIGDRRINKTSIKVRPKKDATVEQADTRSGLIKSIEAYSRAERVYDASCEDQVICGISNFRIDLDYADNDVFEQDIFVRQIANPLAVIWDFMSIDPTGRDANHCFVQDIMPRKVYDQRWGEKYPCPGEMGDDMTNTIIATGWFDKDVVRLTEHWRMIERERMLALMTDGDVKDVTDLPPEQYQDQLFVDPQTGKPKIRKAIRTYAQMHLTTGFCILEGPYELPLTRLPIIKVTGRETRVGDDRVRFGLVRFAKDSQRLKNYWRSVSAETLALAPKSQWFGPDDAFEGREDDFRNAHKSGDPLLIFNKNASAPPQRVEPPQISSAVLNEANMNQQDIKDVTGLHDASLGVRSNEISGRAIQARQKEGDVATVIFHDNLNNSIMEGGDIINQLIPIAYDTIRTVRVIGADDKHKLMTINDPHDENSPDITSGKYDVSIETGPSYSTQRQEAADAMMQAIQVAPQLMQIAGDLIVKAQDWPGAQEISERLKKTIPPQLLEDDDPDKPKPEENAPPNPEQQAQMMQMAEQQEAMKHASGMRVLELAMKNAELVQKQAEANAAPAQAAANVEKANAETRAAQANADKAEAEARHAPARHAQEILHAERAALVREQPKPAPSRSAGPRPGGDRSKPAAPRKGKTKKS